MGYLSALQYGLSGLSAILFIVTVGILRAEQKRTTPRPEVLSTLRLTMAFAVFMVIIPAATEAVKQYWDTQDATFRTTVREQVRALSSIEDLKAMDVLGHDIPQGDPKTHLIELVSKICAATVALQKTVGDGVESDTCKRVDNILKTP
jgi:hypothetical protein